MLLGSEEGGVEPTDYPLARERCHPGLCLVDRVLPSSTYTLKDKVSPLGEHVTVISGAIRTSKYPRRFARG
jgi:hypothetical protein